MTRIFIAMVGLLPLGLCGCSSDPTCGATPNPTTDFPTALLVVGEPVEMDLYPFESGGCSPVGVLPESLTAEITSPDGQPVPNETSLNLPTSLAGTLRFTPEKGDRSLPT